MKKLFAFLLLSLLFFSGFLGILHLMSNDGLRSVLVETLAEKPKLIVFHAPYCRNCPSSDEIAELQRLYPNIEVEDVDIVARPDLKEKYGIRGVPFFVFCTDKGCWPTRNQAQAEQWIREL